MEGYQNFNQDGILIIGTHGIISRQILEQVVPLEHLAKRITFEPQATMLQLHTFKVDKAENAIHLIGNFEDGNNFAVKIDYLNFRMYIEAPIASLLNEENFKLFDFSETKNEN